MKTSPLRYSADPPVTRQHAEPEHDVTSCYHYGHV